MVNKEQKQKYDKKYYEKNKEKIQAIQKKYRKNNLEKTREYNKKYRETNREKSIEYKKKWYQKNKEKLTEIYDKYRENNREKIKAYKKQYRKENHMKITINKWKSRGLIVDDEDEYDGIYYLVMSTEKCERCPPLNKREMADVSERLFFRISLAFDHVSIPRRRRA